MIILCSDPPLGHLSKPLKGGWYVASGGRYFSDFWSSSSLTRL